MIVANKRATESFLVAGTDTTTMPSSGTLNNTTTGAVNLASGQLGIVSLSPFGTVAMNAFVDATPTIDEAPVIGLFQGTAASASPSTASATFPLWVRPYRRTNPIDGQHTVRVTKQLYRDPEHSLWAIGKPIASAGEVNVLDETEYAITVSYRGYRVEEMYSSESAASTRASVTTPNFTATPAITHPVDWILSYLGWNINRQSQTLSIPGRFQGNAPVVAMAVTDTAAGTLISGITVGSYLPLVNTAFGTRGLTVTQAQLDSINAAATATGFTHILTIDLANAGVITGGAAEGLWIMGMDGILSYVDYVPFVKTKVVVGLPRGFDTTTVYSDEVAFADEGEGLGRVLDLWFKETEGQREYSLRHTMDPVITFASPFDVAQKYAVYNIMHGKLSHPDVKSSIYAPYLEVIAIPSTNTTLISTFDTVMNNWLLSGDNQAIVTIS